MPNNRHDTINIRTLWRDVLTKRVTPSKEKFDKLETLLVVATGPRDGENTQSMLIAQGETAPLLFDIAQVTIKVAENAHMSHRMALKVLKMMIRDLDKKRIEGEIVSEDLTEK